MEELVKRAPSELPTFRGLNYTHGDWTQLSRIGELHEGKYNMMYGEDQVSRRGIVHLILLLACSYPK